jgi:hypothetical protein
MICSAKGCRARATWALRWNNPRLHPPQRRKTWLACDDHRDHLRDFLSARGFLRELDPLPADDSPTPGEPPPAPADGPA